ncbi:MAG: msbA [Holophagaceae bacterium]|nr:msbA [Holophagaceae bacterium]
MESMRRFFKEHMLRFVPWILLASFLLMVAGGLQGTLTASFKFVLEALGVSSHTPDTGAFLKISQGKLWLQSLAPAGSFFRKDLYFIPVLIVGLFCVQGTLIYAGTIIMVRCGIKATQALRERLFGRLLDQEPTFFQKHPVGELLQRCLGDVGAVQGIASNQFAELVRESTKAIGLLCLVLYMNWRLSLVIFVAAPLVILPIRRLSKLIRKVNHGNQEASAMLLQRIKEVFSNVRVVIGYAREDYEVERFRRQNHQLYRLGMRSARISALSSPIMEIVGGLILAILIIYVGRIVESGQMSGTGFAAYLMSVYAFYDPVRRLTKLNNEVQAARASLDRVYSILDRQPEMHIAADPKPVPTHPEVLRFEEVRFSYEGRNGRNEVLKGISLEVRKGETVALVGGSGGGKTTLVNLVPRFFDPTAGRLTLDGVDILDFNVRDLRRRIGIVTQETLLFMDSIHDNIAYGFQASREAVVAAAKKAHAHDFIAALPKGYDTPLAETGSTLSGGQRQRIAIARALLQDPPILILDEATSALDTESERAVQQALEALMQDRTTLVIAHRLSTVQKATRICVLKHGQIAEMGTHQELLALQGEYDRLRNLQFQA